MTTPDEVLRAMAEAANHAEFIMCDAATCNGMCEAPEVHFAPAIQRALAAAEQAGWVLVPVELTHMMFSEGCAAASEAQAFHGFETSIGAAWAAMLSAAPKVGEP